MIFKNKKVSYDGYTFGSKLEAAVYQILKLRLYAGEIISIQPQDHLVICGPPGHVCKRKITYIADFRCVRPDGTSYWIEAKGYQNERWPMKLALYRHYGPGILELWKGTHLNPILAEIIAPMD